MTIVFVCPGPTDSPEGCGSWLTRPGYCFIHPHIALVPRDASALTGAAAASYADLFLNDPAGGKD